MARASLQAVVCSLTKALHPKDIKERREVSRCCALIECLVAYTRQTVSTPTCRRVEPLLRVCLGKVACAGAPMFSILQDLLMVAAGSRLLNRLHYAPVPLVLYPVSPRICGRLLFLLGSRLCRSAISFSNAQKGVKLCS